MGRAEKRGRGRTDEDVAVEAEVLQHVFAVVRVVPEDAGIREREAVVEGRARFNQRLREVRDAVEAILEPQAVPVDGRRPVRAVDERTLTRAPSGTSMSGPGYCPLKPSVVSVRPSMVRRTGAATSSSVSPSSRRTRERGTHWRPAPAPGRYDVTSGRRVINEGGIRTPGYIGGATQAFERGGIAWPACAL